MYFAILLMVISRSVQAGPTTIDFSRFLKDYLATSSESLAARRQLSMAERQRVQQTDLWQSRLTASENLAFESQNFEGGGRPDTNFRTNNITGRLTQNFPTGTVFEVTGQKFIEAQNPLFNAIDRRYSASLTQDLLKNSFGKSQRAQADQGENDYAVAELQYRQAIVNSCEEAFQLYTETFIQQEVVALLEKQLKDAQKALKISRQLFRDRLINKVDQLTSESDFIDTRLQVEQAQQQLINRKRQIQAFFNHAPVGDFVLQDPSTFLKASLVSSQGPTLTEVILQRRVASQDLAVEKARSDRWTDLQLGLEAGETFGRLAFNGPLVNYNEQFLRANLSVGFDLVNNTENANLKNAIYQKNSLEKEKSTLARTQRTKIDGLTAMNDLLHQQLKSSQKQAALLKEKMQIAFNQMKRARLDFQNYLLHRNAYLSQKRNNLDLQKDLWLNQLALQKEFAHQAPELCEVSS
jgi:outer membrane protein TolC